MPEVDKTIPIKVEYWEIHEIEFVCPTCGKDNIESIGITEGEETKCDVCDQKVILNND